MTREAAKTSWNLFSDLPLAIRGVLLTLMMGAALGVIWGRLHIQEIEETLRVQFLQNLEEQSRQNRIRLDQQVKAHHQAAGLVISQQRFVNYVQHAPPSGENLVYHDERPPWFPDRSIQRTFVKARFAVLLDQTGRAREIFGGDGMIAPALLAHISQRHAIVAREESWIHWMDDKLFLVTSQEIPPAWRNGWGHLALVTPIDDHFLVTALGVNGSGGQLGLIAAANRQLLISGDLEAIPTGVPLASLQSKYLISDQPFFDYGDSDVVLRLVQFAPRAELEALSDAVASKALREIILVCFAFAASFSLVLIWFIRHLQRFTGEILAFTRSESGLEPPPVASGGPLGRMRRQFQFMAEQIQKARRSEREANHELTAANEKLTETLAMMERTRDQLLQSEKMAALGGLVAGVAHEINNPVGIAFTTITHLEEAVAATAKAYHAEQMTRAHFETFLGLAEESAALARANLKRAADLVRSFKMVAVDQTSEERRAFRVRIYLEEILLSLRPKLKNRPFQVVVDCPEDLVITSLPGAFSQIISNLIINSLEHGFRGRDHGRIFIQAELDGPEALVLRYHDDGCGMEPEVISRIFEPFFTTARGRGGSGLGMHIVYNLVHGPLSGTLHCDSRPGAGTTVEIIIPLGGGSQHAERKKESVAV